MDAARNPVRLRQHLGAARKSDKVVDVGSGPPVDALVVVSCDEHAVAVVVEVVSHFPLQRSEVLRFIQKHHLQEGDAPRLLGKLHHHVGEVFQTVEQLEALVLLVEVLKLVKRNVEIGNVVGVLRPSQGVPRQIKGPHDGVVGLHQHKAVIGYVLGAACRQVYPGLLAETPEAFVAEYLRPGHTKSLERQTMQRPEVLKVFLRVEVEPRHGAVPCFVGRFPRESEIPYVVG